jgi:ribosome-associated protein
MTENENTEYRPAVDFESEGVAEPLSLAKAAYRVLDRRSGEKLAVLGVAGKINYTDYIVLCTAKSTTHVRLLADELEYRLGLAGVKADSREGRGDGNSWIVVDYGAVMAHVFTAEAREFYNLDRLFSDADRIEVESDIQGETEA